MSASTFFSINYNFSFILYKAYKACSLNPLYVYVALSVEIINLLIYESIVYIYLKPVFINKKNVLIEMFTIDLMNFILECPPYKVDSFIYSKNSYI